MLGGGWKADTFYLNKMQKQEILLHKKHIFSFLAFSVISLHKTDLSMKLPGHEKLNRQLRSLLILSTYII